jgi:hypothetical protein
MHASKPMEKKHDQLALVVHDWSTHDAALHTNVKMNWKNDTK